MGQTSKIFLRDALDTFHAEVVIAGGGLAGIVTAYELLDHGRHVLLIDKDKRENFGGLAKEFFGGVHMMGRMMVHAFRLYRISCA